MDYRDLAIGALAAALIVLLSVAVFAADQKAPPQKNAPSSVTCADVKTYVAAYGETFVFGWAKRLGYTQAQIDWAKSCLK